MNRTIIAVLSALSSALISYIASNKERKGRKVRGKNKGKLAKIFILQSITSHQEESYLVRKSHFSFDRNVTFASAN